MLLVQNHLGYVNDETILAQSMPTGAMASRPDVRGLILSAIGTRGSGFAPGAFDPSSFGCTTAVRPVGATVTGAGGSVGMTLLTTGAVSGPAAPFVFAAAGLATIFSKIFSHHAQAVARERSVLCAAIPAAGEALQAIRNAVTNRVATTDQGKAGLDALFRDFDNAVAPIRKDCNAACITTWQMRAAINTIKRDFDYMDEQDQAAAQAAADAERQQAEANAAAQAAAEAQAKAAQAAQKAAQPKPAGPAAPAGGAASAIPTDFQKYLVPAAIAGLLLLLL